MIFDRTGKCANCGRMREQDRKLFKGGVYSFTEGLNQPCSHCERRLSQVFTDVVEVQQVSPLRTKVLSKLAHNPRRSISQSMHLAAAVQSGFERYLAPHPACVLGTAKTCPIHRLGFVAGPRQIGPCFSLRPITWSWPLTTSAYARGSSGANGIRSTPAF